MRKISLFVLSSALAITTLAGCNSAAEPVVESVLNEEELLEVVEEVDESSEENDEKNDGLEEYSVVKKNYTYAKQNSDGTLYDCWPYYEKLYYDLDGKLMKYEYIRVYDDLYGDSGFTDEFVYDYKGNLVSIQTSNDEDSFESCKITYEGDGYIPIDEFLADNGYAIGPRGDVFIKFDNKGQVIEKIINCKVEDIRMYLDSTAVNEYLEEETITYSYKYEDELLVEETKNDYMVYKYEDKTYEEEKNDYIAYKYDENDEILEKKEIKSDEDNVETIVTKYVDGVRSSCVDDNVSDLNWNYHHEEKYDEYGNRIYFLGYGDTPSDHRTEENAEYIYDNEGNIIHYEGQGGILSFEYSKENGVTTKIIQISDNGFGDEVILEDLYDENNRLISHMEKKVFVGHYNKYVDNYDFTEYEYLD